MSKHTRPAPLPPLTPDQLDALKALPSLLERIGDLALIVIDQRPGGVIRCDRDVYLDDARWSEVARAFGDNEHVVERLKRLCNTLSNAVAHHANPWLPRIA